MDSVVSTAWGYGCFPEPAFVFPASSHTSQSSMNATGNRYCRVDVLFAVLLGPARRKIRDCTAAGGPSCSSIGDIQPHSQTADVFHQISTNCILLSHVLTMHGVAASQLLLNQHNVSSPRLGRQLHLGLTTHLHTRMQLSNTDSAIPVGLKTVCCACNTLNMKQQLLLQQLCVTGCINRHVHCSTSHLMVHAEGTTTCRHMLRAHAHKPGVTLGTSKDSTGGVGSCVALSLS